VTLWLFAAIVLVWEAAYLAFDRSYVPRHPVWAACWFAFGLAVLVALVVWRQRWAWWLFMIGPVWYVLSPAWGAAFHPFWDAAELALLGLLLSPPTRRYVFPDGRPVREVRVRRDWVASLILSGLLTALLAVPVRHPTAGSVSARAAGWIVFWLLLATAFRAVARRWPKKAISHRRAWAVSLVLGGALTVLVVVSEHHHAAHSVGARVLAWIAVWFLFSAVIRAIAWIVQTAIRLTRRREDPPAADPGS
jgi:hypothetical protein